MTSPTHSSSSNWLELSEAAEYLGVHFTTLRRWADAGEIDFVRTPGGRRRFTRGALEIFLRNHLHSTTPSASILLLEASALDHTRSQLKSLQQSSHTWLERLSAEQRDYLRATGNHLMALLMQYNSRQENEAPFLEDARRIIGGYSRVCFQAGFSMAETIRAFLFFRRSIVDAIHATGGGASPEEASIYTKTNLFFDELLVSLAEHFTELQNLTIE